MRAIAEEISFVHTDMIVCPLVWVYYDHAFLRVHPLHVIFPLYWFLFRTCNLLTYIQSRQRTFLFAEHHLTSCTTNMNASTPSISVGQMSEASGPYTAEGV